VRAWDLRHAPAIAVTRHNGVGDMLAAQTTSSSPSAARVAGPGRRAPRAHAGRVALRGKVAPPRSRRDGVAWGGAAVGGRPGKARRSVASAGLFGLGGPELLVIGVVAAVLFGPSKLPELGKTLGKTAKSFTSAADEFQAELKKELDTVDVTEKEANPDKVDK